MTTAFYAPPDAIHGDRVVLPPDEAHHAARVLRHAPGDELVVVDGAGGWYRVRLETVDRKAALGTVLERRTGVGEPSFDLTISLGLLKQRARYETFLEKAVELGVAAVVPITTERTEKERLKETRAEGILLAAMKQSGRSRLPQLAPVTPFSDALGLEADRRFLCHEAADSGRTLARALGPRPGGRVHVMVGPEGGFTDGEVAAAQAEGFEVVSLGSRRLRAETAGLTVAAAATLLWEGG